LLRRLTLFEEIVMKSRQSGFTLIELVVVIIILGILAAVAAPKFVNLQGSARAASLNGLRAAVQSASTLANALQTAGGFASNVSVTMDGSVVAMANGYPVGNSSGITTAVKFDSTAYSAFDSTGGVMFYVTSASLSTGCTFTYTAATSTTTAQVGASSTGNC
jgi:MSHA pilin protein MshA